MEAYDDATDDAHASVAGESDVGRLPKLNQHEKFSGATDPAASQISCIMLLIQVIAFGIRIQLFIILGLDDFV